MSYKGLVFAAAALAGTFASTAAGAVSVFAGLAPQAGDAAVIQVDYDLSGYGYPQGGWNAGYGSVRPSFWGYPALWLPGQPKVIATADEIQWARDYEDRYAHRPYDEPGLLDIPGALIHGAFGAVHGALRGSDYFDRPYYGPEDFDQPGFGSAYYGSGYYGGQGYRSAYRGSRYYREREYGSAYRGSEYYSGEGYDSAYRRSGYYRERGYGSAYRGSEYYRERDYGREYRGSDYYRERGYGSEYRGSDYYRETGYGSAYRGSGYDRGPGGSSGWGD